MPAKVSNQDFVVAWATSRTLDEVVKATGMTKPAIKGRAHYLKSKGVKLHWMENTSVYNIDTFEVAQLNSLINKHTRKENS